MEKYCKGCGTLMQFEHPDQLGYSPKKEADYCQRCFRLTHYGDQSLSRVQGIDEEKLMKQVGSMDALIVWVADCFDFEASLLNQLNRHFFHQDVLIVATKRDLLPETLAQDKFERFLKMRLKEEGIKYVGLVTTGLGKYEQDEEILKAIRTYRKGRDVIMMGKANAGKSTVINSLFKQSILTVSRYPGTTLELHALDFEDFKIYDAPGLRNESSLLLEVDETDLKHIVPQKPVRPSVYQIYEDQSFAIGGLCRVDVECDSNASVVFYCSSELNLHRGALQKADALWERHQGKLLSPSLHCSFQNMKKNTFSMKGKKMDIAVAGLGWICFSGNIKKISVWGPQKTQIVSRKAMI
ncbi:MAG: ribosome biogenesis GTPase YqeH [Erysipelotrichaceae bacterium]|nr:ribosome biogenesis GTPase YqeH [Erysipelotrichaceae bacterium]